MIGKIAFVGYMTYFVVFPVCYFLLGLNPWLCIAAGAVAGFWAQIRYVDRISCEH